VKRPLFDRTLSLSDARTLLTEELELARKLAEKQVRVHWSTLENQNAAMLERWNLINERLDRLEFILQGKGIIPVNARP